MNCLISVIAQKVGTFLLLFDAPQHMKRRIVTLAKQSAEDFCACGK